MMRGIVSRLALVAAGFSFVLAPGAVAAKGEDHVPTLEDVTIEGAVAVPEVLFITARDQVRYHDRLHRRYWPSAAEAAGQVAFPELIRLWLPLGRAAAEGSVPTENDARRVREGLGGTDTDVHIGGASAPAPDEAAMPEASSITATE